MTTQGRDPIAITTSESVAMARIAVKKLATDLGFSAVDQTKLVTATSELARNIVVYGGGGMVYIEVLNTGIRHGLRLIFEDHGPGIPDIELALKDGYSSGTGLGLGLSGSKRLVDEFQIESEVGQGTRVTVTKWK